MDGLSGRGPVDHQPARSIAGVEVHEEELRELLLNTRFEAAHASGADNCTSGTTWTRSATNIRSAVNSSTTCLNRVCPAGEQRRVLITGLRALDGRDDLEVL